MLEEGLSYHPTQHGLDKGIRDGEQADGMVVTQRRTHRGDKVNSLVGQVGPKVHGGNSKRLGDRVGAQKGWGQWAALPGRFLSSGHPLDLLF